MSVETVAAAVGDFTRVAQSIPDDDLDRSWAWKDYNSEGVRFAFFRNLEDLRQLAAEFALSRHTKGQPRSEAQHILGNYHAAYRDLQAVLLGIDESLFNQPPAEGEWPVRRAYAHILGGDMGFYVAIRYALERYRKADGRPDHIPEEAWDLFLEMTEAAQDRLLGSSYEDLAAFHVTFHDRILGDFAGIRATELDIPARYWEDEPYSLRFRLHRFESHMRQHTIQIEKTLAALGHQTLEAQRLLRWIYSALAEVESAALGAPGLETGRLQAAAEVIQHRTQEVSNALRA